MPIVKDRGYNAFRRVMSRLAGLGGAGVRVGIQGPEASAPKEGGREDAPLSNVEVAATHEFGIGQPRRSFLADTFDLQQPALHLMAERVAERVMLGKMPLRVGLEVLGHFMRNAIVDRIDAGIEPESADATIQRKGSSKPLIDKGQLKASITHLVEGL